MTDPKPITVEYVAPADYDGAAAPQPYTIVGSAPEGGGGAVESVNGQTGVVELRLADLASSDGGVSADRDEVLALSLVDDLDAPDMMTQISATGVTVTSQDNGVTAVSPGQVQIHAPGSANTGALTPPEAAGTFTVALPSASGTLALASEVTALQSTIDALELRVADLEAAATP